MDSTVIKEIANQLGMAVDQAGQFVTEQLPAFAGLKVVQIVTPFCIVAALFAIVLMTAIISFIVARQTLTKRQQAWNDLPYDSRRWYNWPEFTDSISGKCAFISGIVCAVLIVLAFIAAIFCAGDIIGWSNYPEAMLIDMALKAVG